ncbi:MAG: universal stress protein [Mogibacterium sp.]|nr:universal stress protein [Mogibacterium sp.]
MKRILVPIDGSPRSLFACEEVRQSFSPSAFEVILLMVNEAQTYAKDVPDNADEIAAEIERKLDEVAQDLDKYQVIKRTANGKAGPRIVECAKDMGVQMIVLTRSTKPNLANVIGTTAKYVISYAPCNVMIAQESRAGSLETYRGLIYRKAESVVNLRGQLSLKQSECLLPCVKGDTIYHVDVTRGRVRLLHTSYNSNTRDWDIPPLNGQREFYDITEGESVDIPINAENATGRLDRIRIVNRNMKTEAVFRYRITRPTT